MLKTSSVSKLVHRYVVVSASPSLSLAVTLQVSETEPVVKGQTAASSNKPAVLENGVRTMVPPFVEAGDKIVVDTNEVTYIKRAD